MDDLSATLSQVTDDAPVILLAHEPMSSIVAGSRGGHAIAAIRTAGRSISRSSDPVIGNERFGTADLVYGHSIHGDRHIVVSARALASIVPVRFMRPPEIVELVISGLSPAGARLKRRDRSRAVFKRKRGRSRVSPLERPLDQRTTTFVPIFARL